MKSSSSSKKSGDGTRHRSASTVSTLGRSEWQDQMEKDMTSLKTSIDDMKKEQEKIFNFLQEHLPDFDETEA